MRNKMGQVEICFTLTDFCCPHLAPSQHCLTHVYSMSDLDTVSCATMPKSGTNYPYPQLSGNFVEETGASKVDTMILNSQR